MMRTVKWAQVGRCGWLLVLLFLLSGLECRPQGQDSGSTVEIEKQNVVEVNLADHPQPTHRKIEADTREILEKIAEVNKKHGLAPRKHKPNYFHFPLSYYSRSQDSKLKNQERQRSGFKFANSPFANPIFEYMEKQNEDNEISAKHTHEMTPLQGYKISVINPNAEVTLEDQIPGQYVKRKIIHQQTYIVPNPNPSMYNAASLPNMPMYAPMQDTLQNVGLPPMVGLGEDPESNSMDEQKIMSNLEKQTVDNVKTIVSNSQITQNQQSMATNPFAQYSNSVQGELALVAVGNPSNGKYGLMNLKDLSNPNGVYQIYGPFQLSNNVATRQGVNWPFGQYFPIHIRDPVNQMYNAFTSMIEYGPNAGAVNPCPGRPPNKKKSRSEEVKVDNKSGETKLLKTEPQAGADIKSKEEITKSGKIVEQLASLDSVKKIEENDAESAKNNKTTAAVPNKQENRGGELQSQTTEALKMENVKQNGTLPHPSNKEQKNQEDLQPKTNETSKSLLQLNEEKQHAVHIKETKDINNETMREAKILNDKNDTIVHIKEAREGVSFNINLSLNDREGKGAERSSAPTWNRVKVSGDTDALVINSSRISSKFAEKPKDLRPISITRNQPAKPAVQSPPNRDPTHQTAEFGDESEDDKSDELLISNDGNKKLFSRDNTGSGVFIHKLKVRKGGVAIAGPGGIATAGSGGTAIVGPNGVAYTQPDSLAIAGSGSKVVAVDPTVNLGDIISNQTSSMNNHPGVPGQHAFPPSRLGRVVAVGPVVYYNRG